MDKKILPFVVVILLVAIAGMLGLYVFRNYQLSSSAPKFVTPGKDDIIVPKEGFETINTPIQEVTGEVFAGGHFEEVKAGEVYFSDGLMTTYKLRLKTGEVAYNCTTQDFDTMWDSADESLITSTENIDPQAIGQLVTPGDKIMVQSGKVNGVDMALAVYVPDGNCQ